MKTVYVWDLPLRVFHWLLFGLVAAAFVSAQIGGNAMEWHGRFGIAIIGLLAFRLAWGVVGSRYARFGTFVRGPAAVLGYLRGEWRGAGHNPLGAWSVVAMLAALLVQGLSGLFANDDISFQGPYAIFVNESAVGSATRLHKANMWLLVALVGLHLAAIGFYLRIKRQDLLKPMIFGYQRAAGEAVPSAGRSGGLALFVALVLSGAAAWVASGAWIEAPAPPPAAVPNW